MMVQKPLVEEEKIRQTIYAITNDSFTVLDFMKAFMSQYPVDWDSLVERFGQFADRRRYPVTTYFANRLDVYSHRSSSPKKNLSSRKN